MATVCRWHAPQKSRLAVVQTQHAAPVQRVDQLGGRRGRLTLDRAL
jgi:hypothetical protein